MGSNTIFPKVSIIIPTYNRSALAIETLNSIASQSYDNWECIIVDDGSSTEDLSILKTFVSQKNQRVSEFNLDVFQSIPEFLKSVTSLIKPKDFKEFKVDFQERIYVYISLYTVKSIPYYQFRKVIVASTKYLEISYFQQFILLCLFYGKKYLNKIKGKSLYFKTLKKLYT